MLTLSSSGTKTFRKDIKAFLIILPVASPVYIKANYTFQFKLFICYNLSVNSSVHCSSQDISSFSNLGFDSSQTDSLSKTTVLYHSPNTSNLSCSSQDTVIYLEIMILSLNGGGLRKRLNTPEWEETISSYDIVCIQETHFDVYDSLDILDLSVYL